MKTFFTRVTIVKFVVSFFLLCAILLGCDILDDDSAHIERIEPLTGKHTGIAIHFDGVPREVQVEGAGTWALDDKVLRIKCEYDESLENERIQVSWHSGSQLIAYSYCR